MEGLKSAIREDIHLIKCVIKAKQLEMLLNSIKYTWNNIIKLEENINQLG
jgi:hypothetical protein